MGLDLREREEKIIKFIIMGAETTHKNYLWNTDLYPKTKVFIASFKNKSNGSLSPGMSSYIYIANSCLSFLVLHIFRSKSLSYVNYKTSMFT